MVGIIQRKATKSLIVHNDLAIGAGVISQTRQGVTANEQQIELAFIFRTVAEIRALDITKYTRVQLHTNGSALEYWYDSMSTAVDDGYNILLPDSAPTTGRWLLSISMRHELTSQLGSTDHIGAVVGTLISTNYFDSAYTPNSGAQFRYTGVIDLAKAGNVPNIDGYFYDTDGKQFKLIGPVNLYQFGVLLDGTTDDAIGFQAALNVSKSIKCSSGTLLTSKQITVPSGVHFDCEVGFVVDGSAITVAGDTPQNAIMYFGGGGLTALPALSVNAVESAVNLTFASAHGLAIDDYFCIWNPTDGSWNTIRPAYRAGEWCRVAEVPTSTTVIVTLPLYDSYVTTDVNMYKMTSPAKYSFSGTMKVVSSYNSILLQGFEFSQVVDTDISNLQGEMDKAHACIGLNQCINISGTGLGCHQRIDSLAGLDYGIVIGGSQHVNLEGVFSAERHGSAIGGGSAAGDVVTRDINMRGTFNTQGSRTDTMAANWHGICEYCSYEGIFNGGVAIAGNRNRVRGMVRANDEGIVVKGSELKGLDFDLSGCLFISTVDVTAADRGAFDIGGNSDDIAVHTNKAGLINLSNTTWDMPNTTDPIFTIRNRGATFTEKAAITLNGANFIRLSASLNVITVISAVSGDNFTELDLTGIRTDRLVSYSVIDTDNVIEPMQSNTESVSTSTSATFVDTSITFPRKYIAAPTVVATMNTSTSSTARMIAQALSVTTTGFTLRVATADKTNFSAATTVAASWIAL